MKRLIAAILVLMALSPSAYGQGSSVFPYTTPFMRTVLDDATAAAARTTLELSATDVVTFAGVWLDNFGELRFYDDGGNYVGFEAPALIGDQIYVLPAADGTVRQFLQTDSSGTLDWAHSTLTDLTENRKVPSSMTVTTGTLTAGTVTDVQTWGDGNVVNVTEVVGVPGFDVRYTFTSIGDFARIGMSGYYDGTHHAEIQVFDDTNTTWRTLWTFGDGAGLNYRYSDLPVSDATRQADYISGSNEVLVRFYHPTTGNPAHELFVDYVSLIGSVAEAAVTDVLLLDGGVDKLLLDDGSSFMLIRL